MNDLVFKNSTDAFLVALAKVRDHGKIVSPRGMETKELLSQRIVIVNPRQRCIVLPGRNDDVVAKVAEILWMLAGRDDIEWLSWYLPRAPKWSDDGETWRGAYGPRLRKWPMGADAWGVGYDEVDQITQVVTKLIDNPDTRQAVISIWHPYIDLNPGKDIPCNNWLHFFIRDGKLHLNIAQRSSDVIWGFSGIDAFSWSVLHEMMAYWTDTEVGDFTYFISSLHVYEKHYKKLDKILDVYADRTIYDFDLPTVNYDGELYNLDIDLKRVLGLEKLMRDRGESVDNIMTCIMENDSVNDLFSMFSLILYMGNLVKIHGDAVEPTTIAYIINSMPESDFRVAATEWASRKNMAVLPHLRLTDLERACISRVIPELSTKF